MHEIQNILTDVCGVCLSVTQLQSAVALAVYAACRVSRVFRCGLCRITLTSYYDISAVYFMFH